MIASLTFYTCLHNISAMQAPYGIREISDVLFVLFHLCFYFRIMWYSYSISNLVILLCGYTVLHFTKTALYFAASSLSH